MEEEEEGREREREKAVEVTEARQLGLAKTRCHLGGHDEGLKF